MNEPTKDEGQIMILTLGFVVVALLLIIVVVSAAAVHLERKRLLALADVLALEGADAVADDRYYAPGAGQEGDARLPLTDDAVRAAIEQYLHDNPDAATGWDQFAVLSASTPDGTSATVHLGAVTHPALVSWVLSPWADGITLDAESTARGS